MAIHILSDKERIFKWNDFCMMRGWSKRGELQMWLRANNVKFSPGNSVLAPIGMILKVATPSASKGLIKSTSGEAMATHILNIYCGRIIFTSTEIEAVFWREVIERMSNEFNSSMQLDLIPAYIRDVLDFPENGSLQT